MGSCSVPPCPIPVSKTLPVLKIFAGVQPQLFPTSHFVHFPSKPRIPSILFNPSGSFKYFSYFNLPMFVLSLWIGYWENPAALALHHPPPHLPWSSVSGRPVVWGGQGLLRGVMPMTCRKPLLLPLVSAFPQCVVCPRCNTLNGLEFPPGSVEGWKKWNVWGPKTGNTQTVILDPWRDPPRRRPRTHAPLESGQGYL